MRDRCDLERFVAAQDAVFARVVDELTDGRKRSHWMWFVFPQLAGLGQSAMSRRYAVGSGDEALDYLAHPVLGPRLVTCTGLVNRARAASVREILGSPDDLKFHSSMTLFASVQTKETAFADAMARYFDGRADAATIALLKPR